MNECILEIVYYTFKIVRKSFEWVIAFYLQKDESTFHSMKVKYSLYVPQRSLNVATMFTWILPSDKPI